jgi:hypothetical protein
MVGSEGCLPPNPERPGIAGGQFAIYQSRVCMRSLVFPFAPIDTAAEYFVKWVDDTRTGFRSRGERRTDPHADPPAGARTPRASPRGL